MFKCEICEGTYDTQEDADDCCVICSCCGLYFFSWELNESDYCESCEEEE